MVRLFLILILGLVANNTISQVDTLFESIRLKNCEIQEIHSINDTIYGIEFSAKEIIVSAESKVQMSCNYGNPASNQYSVVKNKFSILLISDTSGKLKDSILAEIGSYIDQQEDWGKKYHVDNDFSNFPFDKSFYLSDSIIIPTIWTGSERNGDFYIYYLNRTLIKIKLIEQKGLGSLSSFNRQNLILKSQNNDLLLKEYIKKIDVAKKTLEAFKDK